MATLHPTVLDGIDIKSFIQHLLNSHGASSTLVVCSSKEAFLSQLQEPTDDQVETEGQQSPNDETAHSKKATQHWTAPTLRLLASAQKLRLAFCEDVPHLRAYLTAYPYRSTSRNGQPAPSTSSHISPPTLAILNLIHVHRHTTNFSAQGLNRTFSAAIDAAHKSRSRLLIAECKDSKIADLEDDAPLDDGAIRELENLWDEEVSILNVATKTFGAGERGWVGRTVKLKAIASRWCEFEKCSKE